MRVNIYHEELRHETKVVTVTPDNKPGRVYYGVRLFQHSAPELHATPDDDDRSAVTFWCGTLAEAEVYFGNVLAEIRDARAREERLVSAR